MGNRRGLGLHLIVVCIFLVATAYTSLGLQNTSAVCSEQELLALLKFKQSVEDDSEMLSSWVGNDCCMWERILCDVVTGNVESLDLRANIKSRYFYEEDHYLVGNEVSSSLAELKHLKYLDLSGNRFGGSPQIPEFIGSLKQLRYLNFSRSGFGGIVPPHIGNLSSLKVLDLSLNDGLMTNDLAWTFRLSSLEHLDFSSFNLSGTQNWHMVLYMIPSLKELSLSSCGLSNADIRPTLNSSRVLPNIKHLDLGSNSFEGLLPHFLQNLTSLEFLNLSNSNISLAWNFAHLLNMLPSLSELHLSSCGLDKTFLSSTHLNFSILYKIQHIDFSDNSVEGVFPSILTNMSSLRVLDLSRNMLNASVSIMPNILELDLSFNKFKKIEHVGIWRQCHLKVLSASNNHFDIEMIDSPKNLSECSQYALERLDLHESLNGTIPESLGRLANLRGIDLSHNGLTGPIPKFVGGLRFLEVLDLSYNHINGLIPTFIGKLSKLDLSFNQLNGSIPESFGNLATLTDLYLEFNRLTGPIPASLGRLGSLQAIWVHSNFLNGTIPVSIGQLSKLHSLDISNNSLEGLVFEAHFANLSKLKDLDVAYNTKLAFNFSHEWVPPFQMVNLRLCSCNNCNGFPQWLQNQRKLERLILSNATISGRLPTWLHNMNFYFLDLSHNKLCGPLTNLPNEGDALSIQGLYLKNNLFNGSLPSSLCRMKSLYFLDLSGNNLNGKIPKCLWNMGGLLTMILSSNQFSGVIPSYIALTSLYRLKLNDNNFTGEVPREFGKLLDLNVLDLGGNRFCGSIPKWIGENLIYLEVLRLHKNNFTGRIPESLCKASYLQILDVAHNNLKGTIPGCLGLLSAMVESNRSYWKFRRPLLTDIMDFTGNVIQSLKGADREYATWKLIYNMDLSSNKLVGKIPVELTALHMLMGLNLSNNHLSGGIPDNIGNMKQLESLDLSGNELTGTIPRSMVALNFLNHMNLSHNNLSGQIPTGSQLQTLIDPSMYVGNKDLCGPPLSKNCSNPEDERATPKKKYKAADESMSGGLFYMDIMCGFATGFWGIIGVLLLKKQWRMKLFMFVEEAMDKIHVAVVVRVAKMKRGREAL